MYMHVKYHSPDTPVEQEVEGRGEEKGGGRRREKNEVKMEVVEGEGSSSPTSLCYLRHYVIYMLQYNELGNSLISS